MDKACLFIYFVVVKKNKLKKTHTKSIIDKNQSYSNFEVVFVYVVDTES